MLKGDVLFVSGSLRRGSYNTARLREAANALPSGVGHVRLDGIAALPPYSEDEDGERGPAAVDRLRRTIAASNAVLIATPEYNGSIPGGLKNAVDWASRPFPDKPWRDTPVAVIGAGVGIFGAAWAQAELRKSLRSAGARVIDAELAVGGAHEAFLPSGALRDPSLATGLRDVVAALVNAQPGREPELAGRAAAREGGCDAGALHDPRLLAGGGRAHRDHHTGAVARLEATELELEQAPMYDAQTTTVASPAAGTVHS